MSSLREALIEIDTLRKRDVQLRNESELLLKAVTVLAESPEGEGVVDKILEVFVDGLPAAASMLLERTTPETLEVQFTTIGDETTPWAGSKFCMPEALKRSGHVFDVQKLPGWIDLQSTAHERFKSALMAPVVIGKRWLAFFQFRTEVDEDFTASEARAFKRMIPLLTEALRREQAAADKDRLEIELRQMQKMEALGTLAGGIAHEINTPMQYVSNNVTFLAEAFDDVAAILESLKTELPDAARPVFDKALEDADFAFLQEELPEALGQTRDGLAQITKIILAIKEFSHPGSSEREPYDINSLVDTALTVSRNQWKYVAKAELDLDETLPMVPCYMDGLRQVLLNLIVNGAQAIEDIPDRTGLGQITIRTRHTDDFAILTISDTGTGMPEHVVERIFDPFYTTKEPGRGTGQGLSISHSIIVQKHEGRIEVETSPGSGTSFHIYLPLNV